MRIVVEDELTRMLVSERVEQVEIAVARVRRAAAQHDPGGPQGLPDERRFPIPPGRNQEDLLSGNPAPQMVLTIKLGAKRDGTLTAIQAHMILDSGAYPNPLAGFSGFHFAGIYRCPNIAIRCDVVSTNKPGTGAYRAPAGPQAYFALESTVQELCQQLGIDPLLFRQINALREGDPSLLSGRWPRIGLLECLEQVQQHPLWAQREQARREVPEELKSWKVGIGLAVGGWPGGTEPAAALCRLEQDGTFTVVVGSVDLSGSDTSLALIAAEELNLATSAVNMVHDNTDSMPYSGLAAGSKTTYTVGSAVLAAARDARNQVFAIAAEMLAVAEGYPTARSAYQLARKHQVDTPVLDEVHAMLYEDKNVAQAVRDLMTRDLKAED